MSVVFGQNLSKSPDRTQNGKFAIPSLEKGKILGQNEGFWRFFTNRWVEIGLFLTLTRFFGKWPKIRENSHVQDSKKSPRFVGLASNMYDEYNLHENSVIYQKDWIWNMIKEKKVCICSFNLKRLKPEQWRFDLEFPQGCTWDTYMSNKQPLIY